MKSKGLFLDFGEDAIWAARVETGHHPVVLEALACWPKDEEDLSVKIREFASAKGQSGFIRAHCSLYPEHRVVHRVNLDPRKIQEPEYIKGIVQNEIKVELADMKLFLLSAAAGTDSDLKSTCERESILCGAPGKELHDWQSHLLGIGIYPNRMELGTVATLGGLIQYQRLDPERAPTLLLEIGSDQTNAFILTQQGLDLSRRINFGVNHMLPVVQRELGLKDESAARRLFFSNTFDFSGMAHSLLRQLQKELQSSISFYELEKGVSVGALFCTLLPGQLHWLLPILSENLGLPLLEINHRQWLESIGIAPSGDLDDSKFSGPSITGLLSLMGNYGNSHEKN